MNIRMNVGYIITDSIHIGETEFVIGIHQHDPNRFVTWACKNGNDYFWGHYLNSREAAEKDLVKRATEQLKFLESIRGDGSGTKHSEKSKERER